MSRMRRNPPSVDPKLLIKDAARLMPDPTRRLFLRGGASLGALAFLSGCDIIDGPSAEHELVLKGRLMTQAPDIDASVFLTDCDPSSFRAGDFVEAEIVGARAYDLVARPVL